MQIFGGKSFQAEKKVPAKDLRQKCAGMFYVQQGGFVISRVGKGQNSRR